MLPNRIGDSILTLPALLCLKQLVDTHKQDPVEITVFSHVPLSRLFLTLDLFEFRNFDFMAKLASWFNQPDKAYFLSTTSKNIGYRAKVSHGLRLPNKKHVRYDVNLPYLGISPSESELPSSLCHFLQSNCSLPPFAIKQFGICLQFGFSAERIINEFRYDSSCLRVGRQYFSQEPMFTSQYVVICMEAAYNKNRAAYRRWDVENFLVLAEKLYLDHGIESVFVGLQTDPQIEKKSYFKDVRGKLSLDQIVQVLHHSRGYIGNDTGPLHLANLLRKKSIGIYATEGYTSYRPLFPEFTKAFMNTQTPEEIYSALEFIL
jgi:ADP-heptose:LPS heptosyltransferase